MLKISGWDVRSIELLTEITRAYLCDGTAV